jgi:serine/threonine protein kinase
MNNALTSPISKRQFKKIVCAPSVPSIEDDERMYNLARGYWVYDELLEDLRKAEWVRFGPGFKAAVYGHASSQLCIKIIGMGVGANPLYFCERGYYLEHERNMLADFRRAGFRCLPEVLGPQESIQFLIAKCGVRPHQAEMRVLRNDLIVLEYIRGIPLAVQTGRHLTYDINVDVFEEDVLQEMCSAMEKLRVHLHRANMKELLHNDPMPPNIIFNLNERGEIEAKLVDFELAQNLKKPSPEHVNNSVAELYRERAVPINPHTLVHRTNLDMYLLDESIELVKKVCIAMARSRAGESVLDAITLGFSFVGGVSINLGKALKYLRRRG